MIFKAPVNAHACMRITHVKLQIYLILEKRVCLERFTVIQTKRRKQSQCKIGGWIIYIFDESIIQCKSIACGILTDQVC